MESELGKGYSYFTKSPEAQECEPSASNRDYRPAMENTVILTRIFELLKFDDLCKCRLVCSNWRNISEYEFREKSRLSFILARSQKESETLDEINRRSNKLSEVFQDILSKMPNIPAAVGILSSPFPDPVLVHFMDKNKKDINDLSISVVGQFKNGSEDFISHYDIRKFIGEKNVWLTGLKLQSDQLVISPGDIPSIKDLSLWECTINLDGKKISPKNVYLTGVKFIRGNNEKCENTFVNEFMNFDKIKSMRLSGTTADPKFNIRLDMSKLGVTVDFISLNNMEIDWGNARWKVKKLQLSAVPFLQRTLMKITSLKIRSTGKEIDLAAVPETIERIYLHETTICSSPVCFPDLKYLNIWNTPCSSLLSHFYKCANLTSMELGMVAKNFKIDVSDIPRSVKNIKVYFGGDWLVGNDQFQLDRFVLGWQDVPDITKSLRILNPDHLVIYGYFEIKGKIFKTDSEIQTILRLIKGPFKTVAVGRFLWDIETWEEYPFLSMVDKIGEYYLFANGNGIAISKYDFDKLNTV